ncbi:LysR family transcriptional regulator [Tenggerimyces flavus]|uniref:LysR family transcriptional regulator n=1 Tax=Tenggerimyces flavus TaxID=1708749 RepID=A0ABV7Y2L4_9ACTN|nr:LysR family transcriptional regulator [Tenggerimyces flavus]MBM7790812.1 DNA-binding transcriptional LysR family regulator [Tenggerimyces flavus]
MELRQLEYFIAVAEERHFTRAAQRMHVAQSGLSTSIRSLERELGAVLFLRNTRSVELTDAGRALLSEARHTLTYVAAARDAVAAVQGVLTGRLVVGSMQCLGALHVPDLLARFSQAHPGIEIHLRHASSPDLVEQVRAGDVDVAFVTTPSRPVAGVAVAPLASEPMVLACGAGHALAEKDSVELGELKEETFVDFQPGWVTRDVTDLALAGAEFDRRVAFEVNDVHSLLDLVGHGLGIALVPHTFTMKRTTARFVPLRAPVPEWRIGIATAAGRPASAAARALLADEALRG